MSRALLAVLLALGPPAAALQNRIGASSAEFLRLGVGGRALGMGEAYTALSEGPEAAYWNPAGLAGLKRPAASYTRAVLPAGLSLDFGGIAAPMPWLGGSFALAYTRLSQEKLELVDNVNQKRGAFAPSSEAISLAYGREFVSRDPIDDARDYFRDNWMLPRAERPFRDELDPWTGRIGGGVAVKLVREDLGTRSAEAVAFDAGGLFRPESMNELILAAALRHAGGRMTFISESAPLPSEAAAAMAYEYKPDEGFWRLLPVAEGAVPYAGNPYGKIGVELSHPAGESMHVALRAGYNSRTAPDLGVLTGLSAGVGLSSRRFSFDSAFQPAGALGHNLRLSLGWRF